MEFFDLSFWQGLAMTFFGVFLGALAAIWVDRWLEGKRSRQKAREILHLLRSSISRDRSVIKKMLGHVKKQEPPSQHVFPSHYTQALYTGGLDVFRNKELWGSVANIPPMFDHLNRRADDLSNLALQEITAGTGNLNALKMIQDNKVMVRENLTAVLEAVDSNLEKLEGMLDQPNTRSVSENEP